LELCFFFKSKSSKEQPLLPSPEFSQTTNEENLGSDAQIETETTSLTVPRRTHSFFNQLTKDVTPPRRRYSAPKLLFSCLSTTATTEEDDMGYKSEGMEESQTNSEKPREKQVLPGDLYHISREKCNIDPEQLIHKYLYSLKQVGQGFFETNKKRFPRGLLAHRILSYVANLQQLHKQQTQDNNTKS